MFNQIPKGITNTQKEKKTDLPFYVTEEKQRQILSQMNFVSRKEKLTGGTGIINPYKNTLDKMNAERRAFLEKLNQSKLYSIRCTPNTVKYGLVIPVSFAFLFTFYIHKINMPKKMLKLKNQYGAVFPRLDKENVLQNWTQETYVDEIYGDLFQQTENKVYKEKFQNLQKIKKEELLNTNKEYKKLLGYELEKLAFKNNLTKQNFNEQINKKISSVYIIQYIQLQF